MIWIFLFLLGTERVDFEMISTVALNVPVSPRPPQVIVDEEGWIWYASYWDHVVYKVSANGELEFTIGGRGKGPGELEKPTRILLIRDQEELLVSEARGRLSLFDAKSGAFIRVVERFVPANGLMNWRDTSFVVVGDPAATDGGLHMYRLTESGLEHQRDWYHMDRRCEIVSGSWAIARDLRGRVYFQEGSLPELAVIEPYERSYKIWALVPPVHYREPPDKNIREYVKYDRSKVDEYYASFTQLRSIHIAREQWLVVCWEVHDPVPFVYQVYDLSNRKLVGISMNVKGFMVNSLGDDHFHTLELVESETLDGRDQHLLHAFKLK